MRSLRSRGYVGLLRENDLSNEDEPAVGRPISTTRVIHVFWQPYSLATQRRNVVWLITIHIPVDFSFERAQLKISVNY